MKILVRFLSLVTGLLLVGAPSMLAQGGAPAVVDRGAIESGISTYLERNGVPGAVVVVTDGPDVQLLQGFGRASDHRPMTPATRVPIASLSKSFTALAVMQLVEDGHISLDTPVVAYLEDFRLADPRGREITVRQLLAHRSGMSDVTFREKSITPVPRSLEGAMRALRRATLASAPGERRSYHNPNYWVAARLVEVVSGMPFGVYMRDRVFLPLGMTRTAAVDALGDVSDVGAGHLRVLGRPVARAEPAWFLGGCCGVVTTGEDLARWVSWHAQVERGSSAAGIVSADSVRLMHEGLGWNDTTEGGHRVIGHNGMLFTFSAHQDVLPDVGRGVGIAVVTNTGVSLAPLDADQVAGMLRRAVAGEAIVQPAPVAWIVDLVLVALIVVVLVALWIAVRRWRRRRWRAQVGPVPVWRRIATTVVLAAPMVWLSIYPLSVRFISRRDLNREQSIVLAPLLVSLVAVLAIGGVVLLVLRLVTVRKRARRSRDGTTV